VLHFFKNQGSGLDAVSIEEVILEIKFGFPYPSSNKRSGSMRITKFECKAFIRETDTFAWDRKIAEVREGDILCFLNAGTYRFSKSSNCNSRLRPAEVWIKDGKAMSICRVETLDDLLRTGRR
jgi:diaminopimelate decarboxylase